VQSCTFGSLFKFHRANDDRNEGIVSTNSEVRGWVPRWVQGAVASNTGVRKIVSTHFNIRGGVHYRKNYRGKKIVLTNFKVRGRTEYRGQGFFFGLLALVGE
jgi:hypothetical protein